MNNFFGDIYVVHLLRREDRMQNILKEQKKLGWVWNIFHAYDGQILDTRPGNPPKGCTVMSMGNYANVLSQREIIGAAKRNKLDSVLILEDDFEFTDDIRLIQEYLDHVPKNWDMLYFGGNHGNKPKNLDSQVCRCNFTLTAHAVGIRHTIYDHLLHITEDMNIPIDLSYAQLHLDNLYNVYAPIKKLCWQINGFSDIESRVVDYSTVLKDAK